MEVIDQIQCLNDEIIKRYLNRELKLCFLLSRDLNYFELMHWYYPISQHWGGYCPFERVHFEIYELVELELVNEKGETMARKYPEPVSAIMLRIKDQDEIIFIRQKTEIQFGSSDEIIGAAFLTNPGSFEFKHSPGWNDFKEGKNGNWEDDRFHAVDFADLTMQNLIEVIRQGYKGQGLGAQMEN